MVDFLLELAEVTDKQVSREELFKEDEELSAGSEAGCTPCRRNVRAYLR